MTTLMEMMTTNKSTENASVLELILQHGRVVREPAHSANATELITAFIEQVPGEVGVKTVDAAVMIAERIAAIDRMITLQLNEIMHDKAFQQLEATWRGLEKLTKSADGQSNLHIKILNVKKKELIKDFERSPSFDSSRLFKAVYEEEFGTLGGSPFGILVTDFEFGRSPQDIRLLQELSHVAASAHAPLVACAASALFDMDDVTHLGKPLNLTRVFSGSELIGWRAFQSSEDARYVALTLPHVLMRLPYGPDTLPVEEFNFIEECDGTKHEHYLWGGASWSLAERIVESYGQYGWCAAIRGVEGGGIVQNLPVHTFKSLSGDKVVKCPVETLITDRREKELSDLGFIPMCYSKGTNYAVFFGGQTVHKSPLYSTDLANANAQLSAMLPYLLAASRFAHYLKAIMRDKVGSFQSRASIERYLNDWISKYVTADDEASQEVKAKLPLREAKVEVSELRDKAGSYSAVVFLRPHFQLEELTASIRLVADLPSEKS